MNDVLRIDPREPGADIKMMHAPDLWPLGAVLPLKRPSEHAPDDIGFLTLRQEISRWTVVGLNIFDDRIHPVLARGEIPDGVKTFEYQDAEDVFDAGWRVS